MFPPQKNKKKNRRRKRRGRHTQLFIAAAAGVLVLAGLIALIVGIAGGKNELAVYPLDFSPTDTYTYSSDRLFYIRDGELVCVDFYGVEQWSSSILSPDMKLFSGGGSVLAYNTSSVQLFGSSGELVSTTHFYGKVESAKCNDTMTAVLAEDSAGAEQFVILDRKGETLKRTSYTSHYIADFGFFGSGSIYVYTINADSVVPQANIETYSSSLDNTGNIKVQGQLLQNIVFRADSLYAVGTNHIMRMNFVGDRLGQDLIYGWKAADIYSGQDKMVLLFIRGGESASATIQNARIYVPDKANVDVQLPAGTIKVALGRERIFAFTNSLLRVYNLSGGRTGEYVFPQEISSAEMMQDYKSILVSVGSVMQIMRMP